MLSEQQHKARILSAIKSNETRNAEREYKPEKPRKHRPVRRVNFRTYNLGEMLCATSGSATES